MDETYRDASNYDRNEMFAIGAAAGALLATAVQEVLDRRRKAPVEGVSGVSDQAQGLADQASDTVNALKESVGDSVAGAVKQGWKYRKQAKKSASQDSMLKDVAAGALSAVAVGSAVKQAKERIEDATASDNVEKARGWFRRASEAIQQSATAESDVITDAAPGSKTRGWWSAAAGTAQQYAGTARQAVGDAKVADRASDAASSARSLLETMGEAIREYLETARETVVEAELGTKARGAAATARERLEEAKLRDKARDAAAIARERLEEAKLRDKARDYAAVAGGTLRSAASTARERIEDVKLDERARDYASVAGEAVKDYGVKASQAAKVGATKLGEGASLVAESTAEGAKDLRKGVRKRVKKTRRRVNWGLRAFIIGLIVGFLVAPQSGQRTRDAVQGFIENVLDILIPEDAGGQSSTP